MIQLVYFVYLQKTAIKNNSNFIWFDFEIRITEVKMDSPSSSTKSRSSRKNNLIIELLKPQLDKMSNNCKKYRQEIKSLQDEVIRLRYEKRQLEHRIEQDDLKHHNEIIKLNEIVEDLQYKMNANENQHRHINHNNDHKEQMNSNNSNNHKHHKLNNNNNNNELHNQQNLIQQQILNSLPNNLNNNLLINKNTILGVNGFNDSYKQLIGSTMSNWMQDSNKKFKSEINVKVQSAKRQFLISLEKEVELIIEQLTSANPSKSIKKKPETVQNELNLDEQFTVHVNPDIKLALKPLKNMIESINQHFNNKKTEISKKIEELEDTQKNLENSLNQTRIADHSKEFELIQKVKQVEQENEQLLLKNLKMEEDNKQLCENEEELLKEIDRFKNELIEFNDNFNQLKQENKQLKHEKSILNTRIKKLEVQNDLNYEIKEQTILGKIRKDNENLAKELNSKFSELLIDLKGKFSFKFHFDLLNFQTI